MKKEWWIALSVVLVVLNLFYLLENSRIKKFSFCDVLSKNSLEISPLPDKKSSLTMLVYFSYRSGENKMKESIYWNKLYKDFSRKEISIIGIMPEEDIENFIKKYNILFPVVKDPNMKMPRRFFIFLTPFKLILGRDGNIFYMAPSSSNEESHREFYFYVVELIKRVKYSEEMSKINK